MGSIYKITNTVNGKSYIGKTARDAKKKRIDYHLNGHGSPLVSNAVKKYGKDAFIYEILHDGIIPELLNSYEIEEIAKHNSVSPNGYNLTTGGEEGNSGMKGRIPWNKGKKMSDFGIKPTWFGKKLSAEHRRNLSKGQKGVKKKPRSAEHCRKLSEVQKGKKRSAEFCRRMSESRKGKPSGRKGVKFSAEHRRKLSESHKGNPSPRKGKKASLETRRKISEAGKGRKVSDETRKEMSKAHKSRYAKQRLPYKEFYLSLPENMSITEKRKQVMKFSGKDAKTVWRWTRQWQSELT